MDDEVEFSVTGRKVEFFQDEDGKQEEGQQGRMQIKQKVVLRDQL